MGRPRDKHPIDRLSLHTRTQIIKITGNCSCIDAYKMRNLIDPHCVYHDVGPDVGDLIDEIESLRAEVDQYRREERLR